jgi:hypothetical protein
MDVLLVWLDHATTALHFGTAAIGFALAVTSAVRRWSRATRRSDDERDS